MARLWSSGAELQPTVGSIEYSAIQTTAPAIETSTIRSGSAAYRISNAAAVEGFRHQFTVSTQGSFFYRFYLYIVALPTATRVISWARTTGLNKITIRMTTGGALQLYNSEDSAQVGSNSSALSTGTWYRIEMTYDSTTLSATTCSARIDGTEFASGTVDLAATPTIFGCGIDASDATLDYIVDDIAINDTTGSFENTWAGIGEQIVLRPNGNGDNSDWGGSDGNSTDNYLLVDEVPVDSADYVEDNTSGQIDDYALSATPAALASDDTINCVQVGAYVALDNATGGDPDIVLRIKAASAGTVEESTTIDVISVTFAGPDPITPQNYRLSLYDLPGASTTAWTKTDLDAAQAGVREAKTDTDNARVASLWVMVDHKPAGAVSIALGTATLTAGGIALTIGKGAVTTTLDTAALLASGQALTVVPGAVTTLLDTAALLANGQAFTVIPGDFTLTLDTALITANGQTIQVGNINTIVLNTATLSAAGQALTPVPGAVNTLLDTALITINGQTFTVVPGAVSKLLSTALLSASGQNTTVVPGAVTTALNTAQLTAGGIAITIQTTGGGAITIVLDTAALLAGGVGLSVVPGAVSTLLNTAQLAASGIQLDVVPGDVSMLLDTAQITANGQASVIVPGGVIIGLDTAALVANGLNITLDTLLQAVVRAWTLHERDTAFTLSDRDILFTLNNRDTDFSLSDRDIDWSLRGRDTSWNVDDR